MALCQTLIVVHTRCAIALLPGNLAVAAVQSDGTLRGLSGQDWSAAAAGAYFFRTHDSFSLGIHAGDVTIMSRTEDPWPSPPPTGPKHMTTSEWQTFLARSFQDL